MTRTETRPYSCLDCLQQISDLTHRGNNEHKLHISVKSSLETGVHSCRMHFRRAELETHGIVADTEKEAKELCAEEVWRQMFRHMEELRKQIGKCLSFYREKGLISNKITHISTNKLDVFIERNVRVNTDIFMSSPQTFSAAGRARENKLALVLGEISLLFQLNKYYMFEPIVRWNKHSGLCEFSCKGYLDGDVLASDFLNRFPCIRENIIEIPGLVVCRICRSNFRTSQYAVHHHSKIRIKLNEMNTCIGTDNPSLAAVVNTNLTAIYKAQYVIAAFVSENKSAVFNSASDALVKQIPDVKLTLFGQSEEGMGQSYYILKFNVSSTLLRGEQLLLAMSRAFYGSEEFQYHIQDFKDANPNVKSSHYSTGLDCMFHVRNEQSVELSKFLKSCGELSAELRTICTLFNFWSSHCNLDLSESGYLYQEVFPLMMMHFLQHVVTPPRFPNLQLDKYMGKDILQRSEEGGSSEIFDTQLKLLFDRAKGDMGKLASYPLWKLWLLMLEFFWVDFNYFHKISLQLQAGGDGTLLPQVRDDLDKDYMRLVVMSPLKPSNLAFSMKTHYAAQYFSDCFRDTLDYYCRKSKISRFKYAHYDYPIRVDAASIDTQIYQNTGNGECRIEESPDLSMEYSINLPSNASMEVLEATGTTLDTSSEVTATSEELSMLSEKELVKHDNSSNDSDPNSGEEDIHPVKASSPDADEFVTFSDDVTTPASTIPQSLLTSVRFVIHGDTIEQVEEVIPYMEITEGDIESENKKNNFIQSPFIYICGFCREKGHTKAECPKEALPKVILVSKPSTDLMRGLNTGLLQLVNSLKMTAKESSRREELRAELESHIRKLIDYEFDLCLFGSSVNKFGSDASDVDLCIVLHPPTDSIMSLEGLPITSILNRQDLRECTDLEYKNKMAILKVISRELNRSKQFNKMVRIPAKVPLIRFEYTLNDRCYRCDISVSNSLALNNSRLLSTYAQFDQRVQDLGLLVKHFGKYMDLADASHGGLSSYAYILLTIHFLQRTDPPIIPVLQQVRPDGYKDSCVKVGEWDCYFCDDIKAVKKVWKHKQNNQNLADLWLEFLCYCVSKFDWDKQVVTLRQVEPLSKVDKYWTNRKICIEDPFNLNHNLGTVLSFRNAIRLRRKFIEARELYHTSVNLKLSLDWLGFDFVPSNTPPIPAKVKSKPPSNRPTVVYPDPEDYPVDSSNGSETLLLSWSSSLNEYCANRRTSINYSDCDFIEISDTLILPSVISADKQVDATRPPNGIKYTSTRGDILLLSGSTAYQHPNLSPPLCDTKEATAPVVQQAAPPPLTNIPSPVQEKESDSLSLEEMTQRIEKESRELMITPPQMHPSNNRPPYNHTLSPTFNLPPQSPKQSLSKSCPTESSFPKEYENTRGGSNLPHGAKGTQSLLTSPGYQMGRGGIRPSPQGNPPAHQHQVHVEERTRNTGFDSSARARKIETARFRGQSRVREHHPKRDTAYGQQIDDIFSPLYSSSQTRGGHYRQEESHDYQSNFYSRGRSNSARGRGGGRGGSNTRRIRYK